jgi:hypothetical protein
VVPEELRSATEELDLDAEAFVAMEILAGAGAGAAAGARCFPSLGSRIDDLGGNAALAWRTDLAAVELFLDPEDFDVVADILDLLVAGFIVNFALALVLDLDLELEPNIMDASQVIYGSVDLIDPLMVLCRSGMGVRAFVTEDSSIITKWKI